MGSLFRWLFLAICAGGGGMGAFQGLQYLTQKYANEGRIGTADGGVLVLVPVCFVGGLLGAAFGGMLLPRQR
jgi:hypothetical protein